MSNFDRAFADLMANEGGYSNNKADPGGQTKYGITEATARQNGYTGAMADLPLETAKAIYQTEYWHDEFDQLPYSLAFQVFDASVNSGFGTATRWLQMAVNVRPDGVWGAKTTSAARATPTPVAIGLFNAFRLRFMASLATWKTFGDGWARRIANNLIHGMEGER